MRYLFAIADVFVQPGAGSPPAALLAPGLPFTVWDSETAETGQVTDLVATDGVSPLSVDGSGRPVADSNGQAPNFRGPDGWNRALWVDSGGPQRFPVYPMERVDDLLTNAVSLTADQTWTGVETFNGAVIFAAAPTLTGGGSIAGPLDVEAVQDAVNAMVVAGTGVAKVYDDTAGTLTLTAAGAVLSNTTQAFTGPTNFTSATASQFTTNPTIAGNANVHAGNIATILATPAVIIAYHNMTTQPYFIRATSSGWPNSGARVLTDGSSMAGLTAQVIWESTSNVGLAKATGMIDTDLWWERVS